jgi:hypothetical protein
VFVPGAGLGGSASTARAQGEGQLRGGPSVGKGRAECRQRPDVADVGFNERERMCEHETRQRYASLFFHRLAAHSRSAVEAELVRWSSDGSLFVVQVASTIDVYTTVRIQLSPPLIIYTSF